MVAGVLPNMIRLPYLDKHIYNCNNGESNFRIPLLHGLWPYNPNVFNAEESLPSIVTDEPQPSDSQQQIQPSTRPNKQQVD